MKKNIAKIRHFLYGPLGRLEVSVIASPACGTKQSARTGRTMPSLTIFLS